MGSFRRVGVCIAGLVVVLAAGCGGDTGVSQDMAAGGGVGDTTTPTVGANAGATDTGVTITVDGVEHVVDTSLGGGCATDGDPGDPDTDLKAYGYDQDGQRVEFSFKHQGAGESTSGQPEYFGFLSTVDGHWQMQTTEPFAWLEGDRSHVTGTATMEDGDGQTVEVGYDIRCP